MAEIVEYRVERTLDELELLVDFGLFSESVAREIIKKRQNFEYTLRRRNRTKLDFLKYIRYEINLLNAIDDYRRTVLKNHQRAKAKDDLEKLDIRLLVLQAKKLNDVVRSRCAHISGLFRKLTTSFQFDSKLWLAYIEFAKSRYWNSRVTALYWRVLRVSGDDENIWISAAKHEVEANKAYHTARGLFLRALRHHPKSWLVWSEYFKMEVLYMDVVASRARIVFKTIKEEEKTKSKPEDDIWAENPDKEESALFEDKQPDQQPIGESSNIESVPEVRPLDEDDVIISGHLPKVVYKSAFKALDKPAHFHEFCLRILEPLVVAGDGRDYQSTKNMRDFVISDLKHRHEEGDSRISGDLIQALNICDDFETLRKLIDDSRRPSSPTKRLKTTNNLSMMDRLYERYESDGIDKTRELFTSLEKSMKNQKLSLYVGMIQVELWQFKKDPSGTQKVKVRTIFEKALAKFGKMKPKLWYEYIQFEHEHSKTLEDIEYVNRVYTRAQATVVPSKVGRVIERYSILQTKSRSCDIDYSDYSDLDD